MGTSYDTDNFDYSTNKVFKDWWEAPLLHQAINALINSMGDSESIRSQQNIRFARLYGNLDILGLSPTEYFRTSQPTTLSNRISLNVIKSCIDTISCRIAKNKPRPQFLTSGGDWSLQRKAKKLNKFVQGVFYETDFYRKAATAFRDSCIFGTGFIKVFISEEGRLCFERIVPEEIKVDAAESVYGTPQSLFQLKSVNRSRLMARFGSDPEKAAAISVAANVAVPSGETVLGDMVRVTEAWHLPSKKNGPDGKHAIVINGCTLFEEPYNRKDFPFLVLRWSEPIVGFFGTGLAEELMGIQLEVNKLLRNIQMAHHLLSAPKVLLENNAKIVSSHMNNEIGAIIKFTGTKPDIHAFQTVHPEIYAHLERLYSKAYQITGISELSAQAKKPAGLDSGVALREFSDIESERYSLVQQRFEDFAVDAAEHIVELGREIVTLHGGFKVKAPNKKVIEDIDFKDVDLADSSYILQCFPTNFLPNTPAGRLQSVQELMQAGLIPKEVGLSLLDFPDLEGAMSLANAALDDIMLHLEQIIEDGKYNAPEPMMNLGLARDLAQASYLKAKCDNVPESHLKLLRQFAAECQRLITVANPPPPMPSAGPLQPGAQLPPGPLPPGAPMAQPMPAPQSPFLPVSP